MLFNMNSEKYKCCTEVHRVLHQENGSHIKNGEPKSKVFSKLLSLFSAIPRKMVPLNGKLSSHSPFKIAISSKHFVIKQNSHREITMIAWAISPNHLYLNKVRHVQHSFCLKDILLPFPGRKKQGANFGGVVWWVWEA